MTCINFTDARITALKPCRATHDIRDTKLKSVPVGMVPTWEAHAGTASKMWTAGPGIGSGGLRSGEAPCVRHHSTRTSDPVQRSAAHHRDPCGPAMRRAHSLPDLLAGRGRQSPRMLTRDQRASDLTLLCRS